MRAGCSCEIPLSNEAMVLFQNRKAKVGMTRNGKVVTPINIGNLYVFPTKAGGKRVCISSPAKKISLEAGLPLNCRPCHGLRNLYLSRQIASGADINTVRLLAGHKDITTTQIYFTNDKDAMKRAAQNVGGMFSAISISSKNSSGSK